MASGHVNRTSRPNTWQHRPSLRREDSSCQPGAVHTWHKADLLALPPDVGFREKSRRTRYAGRCQLVTQSCHWRRSGFRIRRKAEIRRGCALLCNTRQQPRDPTANFGDKGYRSEPLGQAHESRYSAGRTPPNHGPVRRHGGLHRGIRTLGRRGRLRAEFNLFTRFWQMLSASWAAQSRTSRATGSWPCSAFQRRSKTRLCGPAARPY